MTMLQEALPEAALPLLQKHLLDDPSLLLQAASDLTLDGQLDREWLVLTPSHVAVIAGGGLPYLRLALPTAQVESFRRQAAVGSGFVQARMGGAWVNLLRYSNSLAGRFAQLTAQLEAFRTAGRLAADAADTADERRCVSCGLTLPFAGEVCPRCLDRGAVLARVWALLRPYRRPALVLCALVLLGVAAELAPPKLQQYLVDEVLQVEQRGSRPEGLLATLLLIVGSLAGTRLLLAGFNAAKGVLASRIGTAMTADLRARLVDKLQQLPVDYYDRHPVGVLMSRVAHDTEALYGCIHQLTSGLLLQLLQVAGVGLMLFSLNARLALWTLLPMPLVLYGSWFFWRHVYPRYYRYWDSVSKQAGALAGMLAGIRVVKAFAQEPREYQRFQATSDRLRQARLGVEVSSAVFSAAMQLVFSLGGLIVWFVGGRDVLGGRMTLGALMAFLAYLAMFYAPLTTLAQLTTWLTSFLTASQRVFELLDTPTPLRAPTAPGAAPPPRGHVRFEGVTFGYDRHQPVLQDFNLEIRPGETVGIVGRSGSGKTTLVNLLSRFYDPDAGRVTLDGRDVRELGRADLCRRVGVVLQEPFLFRGTVWENLRYGRPDAPVGEALAAAKGANAHDFILRLPLGYDTPLGERGAGLSGGEKQRLAVARTLLADPCILILDEATSSVDTESEKAIQDALSLLSRGRTTLAIAHRLSTLRHADRILVLDRGKLIEEGTHLELLDRGGTYAKLVRIQTHVAPEATIDGLARADQGAVGQPEPPNGAGRRTAPSPKGLPEAWTAWQGQAEARPLRAAAFGPRWLGPHNCRLRAGAYEVLEADIEGQVYAGVRAVLALPVTHPRGFVSLRYADADGGEEEVGMVRALEEWPAAEQALLEQALAQQYFIRSITGIESIEHQYGLLTFRVQTDRGPARFVMRHSQGQAQDYGPRGKLLVDVDDNRYVVGDVQALPRRQQTLFRQHIYW
jgi:ATP-binding cassette subfamily B protein